MIVFRSLWLFDTAMLTLAFGWFVFYLFRGPVTRGITGAWILLLSGLVVMMLGAACCIINHYSTPALLLLSLMAAPGCVYLLLSFVTHISRIKMTALKNYYQAER